jgi:hypothetical protein
LFFLVFLATEVDPLSWTFDTGTNRLGDPLAARHSLDQGKVDSGRQLNARPLRLWEPGRL